METGQITALQPNPRDVFHRGNARLGHRRRSAAHPTDPRELMPGAAVPDLDRTAQLLVLGFCHRRTMSAPSLPARLVVDPMRIRTAAAAGGHVVIRPGAYLPMAAIADAGLMRP